MYINLALFFSFSECSKNSKGALEALYLAVKIKEYLDLDSNKSIIYVLNHAGMSLVWDGLIFDFLLCELQAPFLATADLATRT